MLKLYNEPDKSIWGEIVKRSVDKDNSCEESVTEILKNVARLGDQALKEYSLKFDKVVIDAFRVSANKIKTAGDQISIELKNAIEIARKNIELFHRSQITKSVIVETMPGVECWQRATAIEKIGIYIPGGSAPLFSTVLMLAIPAAIAGCKEIILCSPPDKSGQIHPAILYTASLCGITEAYALGGAQAIAAMAYGTDQIPQVFKIFGPGNSYVTMAKVLVQKDGIAIDIPAGPSEVLVYVDKQSDAEWVAADLLSQAEHGADSQVVLVSDNEEIINLISDQLVIQLASLPRKELAESALKNSFAVCLKNKSHCIDFINTYAPEHLILHNIDAESMANNVINAGSVFIGPYSPESVGDYASGTNHTLPTSAYARAYSGLNLDAFMKKITFQKLSAEGLKKIGPVVEIMAEAEKLEAHKKAISLRLKKLNIK